MDPDKAQSKRRPYLRAKDKIKKKGRIIIRNLSYKANEEKVMNFFKSFGDIKEVSILKYTDGRMKGVAFLQFKSIVSALKAIKECNMKLFMGRPIAVDLAVPKDKYKNSNPMQDTETKDFSLPEVKMENSLDESWSESMEDEEKEILQTQIKQESDESDAQCSNDSEGSDQSKNDDSESDGDNEEELQSTFVHKPVSKDVTEGKTLFLRNLILDATEEQMTECLSQFGDLKYVLFCRDKITKRFRGTAFAQYLSKESADACLEAFSDPTYRSHFKIGGRTLFLTRAVGREDIRKKEEQKKKENEPKDKRNLGLAREGVIREGTKAAKNVSKSDLVLRVQREIIKRKMLANLNIFISPVRLFVCNLPLELTDKELSNIFRKYSHKDAVITECKIMRNLYELDNSGMAVSKGHGFVTFTQHRHAVEALRNINNNPDIFTSKKRPVVEFSLENKGALKAKASRMQKSRDHNIVGKVPDLGPKEVSRAISEENSSFMGSNYDPKIKGMKALHSHIGPKIRHKDSKNLKKGGKITRNKINNQLRNARALKRKRNGPKMKANQKSVTKASFITKAKNSGRKTTDSTKKPKTKKRKFI